MMNNRVRARPQQRIFFKKKTRTSTSVHEWVLIKISSNTLNSLLNFLYLFNSYFNLPTNAEHNVSTQNNQEYRPNIFRSQWKHEIQRHNNSSNLRPSEVVRQMFWFRSVLLIIIILDPHPNHHGWWCPWTLVPSCAHLEEMVPHAAKHTNEGRYQSPMNHQSRHQSWRN